MPTHAGFIFSKCSFPFLATVIMQIAEIINTLSMLHLLKAARIKQHTFARDVWHGLSRINSVSV
jgi:hypothetical protein